MKLRACMLAYTYYETDNRVRRYSESLVKEGYEVDVVALRQKGQSKFETIKGVNLYKIQRRIINEKWKISYFLKIISFLFNSFVFVTIRHIRNPYKLIHVHSVPDFEVFAALIPRVTGCKIILDIHDIVPEFYASKFNVNKNAFVFKLLVLIEKFSIMFSHHVIIANDIWYQTLISRSVKDNKCTPMINFPDTSIFYTRPHARNNKFIMMYPGTLNWHQGVDIAIEAMSIIKEVPDLEFHIYGAGPETENLKKMASELGLDGKVYFKGLCSLERIAEKMSQADLGVVPKRAGSFGNEAFSTKTMEFMALGVPVIASDTKIDKYYFNDSLVKFFKSEDVEDLAESMLLLIQNDEIRTRLSENASVYIKQYNWDVWEKDYLQIVERLTC